MIVAKLVVVVMIHSNAPRSPPRDNWRLGVLENLGGQEVKMLGEAKRLKN